MSITHRQEARGLMRPFIERLAAKPEVAAVAVLSNAALPENRTWFDEDSDFDLSVLIRVPGWRPDDWRPQPASSLAVLDPGPPAWLPNFLFGVEAPWGEMEVNVNQLALEYELDDRTHWDHDKCDVYLEKCAVVHDPAGDLTRLIRRKTDQARASFPQQVRRLAYRLTWDVERVPLVALRRAGPAAAHHLLNNAVEEYIQLVYLLHGRFVAAMKWRLVTLEQDGLVAPGDLALLHDALRADCGSAADVHRRVQVLRRLWQGLVAEHDLGSVDEIRRRYLAYDVQLRPVTAADAAPTPDEYARANLELRET
jgi:hypothetical protein